MIEAIQHGPGGTLAHWRRRAAVVFTVAAYTIVAPFGGLLFALACRAWRGDPARRAARLQHIAATAYRLMHGWLRWTGIADFDHLVAIPGVPAGPCVVIANHPTLMDITAITAVLGGGSAIVKPAMFRRRVLHRLMLGAGHIEGPGADPLSIRRVVDQGVERLRAGMRVIVFPEGTRSPSGGLHAFGRAPFEIACRGGVPLVSLTVVCDPLYLSKDVPLLRPPRQLPRLRLGLLAVDDPATAGGDSRTLRDRCEQRYRRWLETRLAPVLSPSYHPLPKEAGCQISSKLG